MVSLRMILAGTVSLALVGGLSWAVVAQAGEPTPITFVTGTVTEVYPYESSDEEEGDLTTYDLEATRS